jgi:hypothetical protein
MTKTAAIASRTRTSQIVGSKSGWVELQDRRRHSSANAVRRRSHLRSGLATGLLLALAVLAWSSSGGAATPRTGDSAAAMSAAAQPPLVGTWRRVTTCAELTTALTKARLKKFVLEFIAGNGFIPGVTRPNQIANPANPCKGAVPRRHSHLFTKDRKFGSLDWRGQPVDDGSYRLVNRTLVIFKSFRR